MYYMGVDPGVSGGMAVLDVEGHVVRAKKFPDTSVDLWGEFREYAGASAMLEFVRSSPQMGVASSFSFGASYGLLRGFLIAADVSFEEVTPRRWQKAMGCLTGGDKNISKARAQELFPRVKITHAIADALLIAEYCRRCRRGLL